MHSTQTLDVGYYCTSGVHLASPALSQVCVESMFVRRSSSTKLEQEYWNNRWLLANSSNYINFARSCFLGDEQAVICFSQNTSKHDHLVVSAGYFQNKNRKTCHKKLVCMDMTHFSRDKLISCNSAIIVLLFLVYIHWYPATTWDFTNVKDWMSNKEIK